MSEIPKLRKLTCIKARRRLVDRYRMGLHTEFEIWQLYGIYRSLLHKWNCQCYRFRILPYINLYKKMKSSQKSDKAQIAELEKILKSLIDRNGVINHQLIYFSKIPYINEIKFNDYASNRSFWGSE